MEVLKIDEWITHKDFQFIVLQRTISGKIYLVKRIKDGVEYRVGQIIWEEYSQYKKEDHVLVSYILSFNENRKHVDIHNKFINQEEVVVVKSYGEEPWEVDDLPEKKEVIVEYNE